MPKNGEIISQDNTSSIDNIDINDWTKIQMTNTLNLLNGDSQPSFYKIEGEKVIYNMDTVKDYLTHLCKKEDGTLNTYKEMTDNMWSENLKAGNDGTATTSWIIAVQIALEYIGYDVGKIDGNLGGDTEKAIKDYQREYGLGIDGVPGPKVIEKIINDIDVFMDGKKEYKARECKLIENAKNLGFKDCITINKDGTITFSPTKEFMDTMNPCLTEIGTFLKNSISGIECDDSFIKQSPIYKLFNGVMTLGECWAITVDGSDKRIRLHTPLSIIDVLLLCNKGVTIIPPYLLGYDRYFFQLKDEYETLNDKQFLNYYIGFKIPGESYIDDLRGIGITMEDSKEFVNKYLEINNIGDIKNIDSEKFFNGKLNKELIEFLFEEKIDNLKSILPMTVLDGLKFYKIKKLWGESKFKKWIPIMIKNGILNNETKSKIDIIIKTKLSTTEIPEYIKLCNYLKQCNYEGYIPDLHGYTIQEYFDIVKYMQKYDIEYESYSIIGVANDDLVNYTNMSICNKLLKHGIPGSVINFLGKDVMVSLVGGVHFDSRDNKIEELFIKNGGLELYSFLSKYPQILKNLGGKKVKEIKLNANPNGYNFCFRGILEMIKSRSDFKVPNLEKLGEQKWKESRENIIKEYERLLRNYLSLDRDEKGKEIPREQTFDKIFFASAVNHIDEDWNGATQGENKIDYILKSFTKNFEDCSNIINENGDINKGNQENMIEKIKQYTITHPNEKILVCADYHGGKDGSSSNGWKKEDWEKLANISPNIKIMSIRCYFGSVYNNADPNAGNYIYSIQSPISGFSNGTSTLATIYAELSKGYKKGLGFHEMEIYARLNYDYSFTPLTEYMDFIDFRTRKKNRKIVGLADAGIGTQNDDIA